MIEILDSVSEPGSKINEDCFGHAHFGTMTMAWVLDGATGVAGRDYVPAGPTDAAWLAATLSDSFREESPGADLADYFSRILGRVGQLYRRQVPEHEALPSYALPSAAGIWARLTGTRLDLAWMGDCVAAVTIDGQVHLAGAVEAIEQNAGINRVVADRLAQGNAPQPMLELLGDELRARRSGLNRPGGYWMFGIEPAAAAGVQHLSLDLDGTAEMLLCSDGFWRLVDHFGGYSASDLIAAAHRLGLTALLEELRRLEADDPDGRRVPRVKPHDDATAILCRVQPRGLKSSAIL